MIALAAALIGGQPLPDCGRPVAITRDLLAELPDERLRGTGDVLIGDRAAAEHGSIAFVRRGGRWRAWSILDGASAVAVYRAPATGAVFVWAMIDLEGPGPSYTQMFIPAGTARPRCTVLRFPAALNHPSYAAEFLEFDGFRLDARGRGTLTGTATVERHGRTQRWTYRYTTRDFGRSWSAPRQGPVPFPQVSVYRSVGAAPARLVASLRAVAR